MTQDPPSDNVYPLKHRSTSIGPGIDSGPPHPHEAQNILQFENPYKLADTVLWKRHEAFQPEFLEQYRDVVLYDILNHIRAFLLYPPVCRCENLCLCTEKRQKVILSLNTHSYNRLEEKNKLANLFPLRLLLNVPEDHFFRKNSGNLYPLWLIQQGFQKSETVRHFKRVDQLVWALLCLARTWEVSPLRTFQASVEKALEIILGKGPLKTQKKKRLKELQEVPQMDSLGGEKAYRDTFRIYKSLCPFIAAFNMMKETGPEEQVEDEEDDPWEDPRTIERLLKLAHFFRKMMLQVTTPNVKDQSLFSDKTLFSLPPWIHSDDIDIPLHPLKDKLQEIRSFFKSS